MASDEEREQISERISNYFQGLDLDDVAGILAIQLAMLVCQGADDVEGAIEFLDEIHEQVEELVRRYPFGEDGPAPDADPMN